MLSRHLHLVALATEVHRTLLIVVVVNHLLILVPDEIALRGVKLGRCLIHCVQGGFQALGLRDCRDDNAERDAGQGSLKDRSHG